MSDGIFRHLVTFDHRDEESHNNPCPRWKQLRGDHPVAYSNAHDGFYVLSRYQDVVAAARDTSHFSSAARGIPQKATPREPPINYDPPENRAYREILSPYFAPARIAEHEPWIREIVSEIVDPLIASQAFDVPRDVGMPLTRRVTLRFLGMADPPIELNEWVDTWVLRVDEAGRHAGEMLVKFLSDEIERRRQSFGQDVFSAALRATIGGRPLTDEELVPMGLLLLGGGLETTTSALTAAIAHLIDHPENRARLLEEPEIWDMAMDEFVRWASPVPCPGRMARQNAEVAGCPIPDGERVMLLYGSANRDETEFTEPDTVILDRHPNRHLGFGMGPHRCLGSHLAKLQMKLALQRILPVLGDWQIEDPAKITWKAASSRGMSSLPLVRKLT
jgi:cytochrome P450